MARPLRKMVLPVQSAFEIADAAVKESEGLHPTEEQLIALLGASCSVLTVSGNECVRVTDLQNFIKNLTTAVKTKDSSYLTQKRGIKVDRIVDVQEFVESKEYMNQKTSVRPYVMQALIELFANENHVEAVLTGSIGWGKTFCADMGVSYMVYRLSCYHNPQLEYDLAPGSSIYFIQQSKKYELARKVVFGQFAERLKMSPYFKRLFPFDVGIKSELRFPSNIYVLPVGGTDTSALGMNVMGGIIDEMNFMARVKTASKLQFTGDEEYDQAEALYRTLIRRMKSRFMQKGKLPGILFLVSSVNYPGDFTDRKLKEAKTDKTIFTKRYSVWEVLPDERFSGEKFYVEVGNDVKQSRILKDKEEASDADDVIEVPVEYKSDFERNLEEALKDYAGRTLSLSRPFIPYKELIVKGYKEFEKLCGGQMQLFKYNSVIIDDVVDPMDPNWEDLVNMDYIEEQILDRSMVFATHIDVAINQDSAGLALGRLLGYRLLPASKIYDNDQDRFVEVRDIRAPIYIIDGILQIRPPRSGREIDLELIRDLVLWLRGRFNLRWASLDSYQSRMMIQSFRRAKIRSGVLSVDETIAPYAEVKSAIKDERILYPQHEVFLDEIRRVERDPQRDKIDHPPGFSKDCSDAVAGVVYLLQTREARYGSIGRGVTRGGRVGRTTQSDDGMPVDMPEETQHVRSTQPVRSLLIRRRR